MTPAYYYDFEFIEDISRNWVGPRRHFIDMISVGIVCSDGREYSAISSEYRYNDASIWVIKNVIEPLYLATVHGDLRNMFTVEDFHKTYGKSNKKIAEEIAAFTNSDKKIKLYGYYSAYDHVLLSSLFGTMMKLPKHFPMFTIDLKQMLDERVENIWDETVMDVHTTFTDKLEYVKSLNNYPAQENEHDALADARWNKALHEFIELL